MKHSKPPLPTEEDISASAISSAAAVQYRRAEDASTEVVQDTFEVLATDMQSEAVTVVTLSFSSQHSRGPPSSREEVVTLQVTEGERVVLTSDYFTYALSGGGGRSQVTYTLLDTPHYGTLTLHGRNLVHGDAFSQDDANKGRLSYRAVAEIGRNEVIERIPLSIKDSSGSRYRPQLLAITVTPTDNQVRYVEVRGRAPNEHRVCVQAPVMLVNGELVVKEGETEVLPDDLLTVMDPDSSEDVLQLVLDAAPSFGYLTTSEADIHAYKNKNVMKLVNDEAPVLVTDILDVESADGVVIRNSSLYVGDFDTPARQLVLTLLQEPRHGKHILVKYITRAEF
ncbi:hypothetical protein B566_EDAN001443 [Ephemera danica]|nr:hypothetical protein B566_EDAN001443 [Ephemera danica]